jgi:hypothetical protein
MHAPDGKSHGEMCARQCDMHASVLPGSIDEDVVVDIGVVCSQDALGVFFHLGICGATGVVSEHGEV